MTIIYGGSFNPPTIAHYEIAKFIISKFPNHEFYFLPTNNAYGKADLNDFYQRIKMLEIVCNKLENKAKVSDLEGKMDKYYGTYYSLEHFKNPYFVMGADNLETITKWINYPALVINYKFIILPRDNINVEEIFKNNDTLNKYKDNFIILDDFDKIYISSSLYRKTKNKSLLLEEVEEYIKTNNLYKEIKN